VVAFTEKIRVISIENDWSTYKNSKTTHDAYLGLDVTIRQQYLIPSGDPVTIKDCPAKWIRPKLGSFDRSSLKREAQKVFKKIRLPPIL
jgi:hypothetical protein